MALGRELRRGGGEFRLQLFDGKPLGPLALRKDKCAWLLLGFCWVFGVVFGVEALPWVS